MSEHNLNFMPSEGFRARAKDVVENPFLRQSFRGAMDFLITKRAAQFPSPEELETLRTLGEQIRQYNLGKLPALLLQLEENLTRNGIQVHWAETPDEANAIILGICQRHSAKLAIKQVKGVPSHRAAGGEQGDHAERAQTAAGKGADEHAKVQPGKEIKRPEKSVGPRPSVIAQGPAIRKKAECEVQCEEQGGEDECGALKA